MDTSPEAMPNLAIRHRLPDHPTFPESVVQIYHVFWFCYFYLPANFYKIYISNHLPQTMPQRCTDDVYIMAIGWPWGLPIGRRWVGEHKNNNRRRKIGMTVHKTRSRSTMAGGCTYDAKRKYYILPKGQREHGADKIPKRQKNNKHRSQNTQVIKDDATTMHRRWLYNGDRLAMGPTDRYNGTDSYRQDNGLTRNTKNKCQNMYGYNINSYEVIVF
jgi:hypothetical protein